MRKVVIANGLENVEFVCGPQHEGKHPACKSVPDAINVLEDLLKIQGSSGNWNYDSYMQGMYNGLACAISCISGEPPKYKSAPKEWLEDRPTPVCSPTVAVETSSVDIRQQVESLLSKLRVALSGDDVDTMAKAYAVFRKFGITGFKSPKMGGDKGTQIVKAATITIKNKKSIKYFHVWLRSKGDDIEYQLTTPGRENYTSDKLTRKTTDINKFLNQLLTIKGLSDYHSKIKEYLDNEEA